MPFSKLKISNLNFIALTNIPSKFAWSDYIKNRSFGFKMFVFLTFSNHDNCNIFSLLQVSDVMIIGRLYLSEKSFAKFCTYAVDMDNYFMFMELHLAVWKSGDLSAITSKSPSISGYLYVYVWVLRIHCLI